MSDQAALSELISHVNPGDVPAIRAALERVVADRRRHAEIIELFEPEPVESPEFAAVLAENAEDRREFLRRHRAVTAETVAERARSQARNRFALASRWQAEGRIFGVAYHGRTLFPVFQFDTDGRPRPVISAVLSHLAGSIVGWEVALWFDTANGWLGGRAPLDVLEGGADDEVVRAAAHEAQEPF